MLTVAPEAIHPALWPTQLARGFLRTVPAGDKSLSSELPGGGWPIGTLVEMLVQQPGIRELCLLRPALRASAKRPIALVMPPRTPQTHALANCGIAPERLMWIRAQRTADVLWATERRGRASAGRGRRQASSPICSNTSSLHRRTCRCS